VIENMRRLSLTLCLCLSALSAMSLGQVWPDMAPVHNGEALKLQKDLSVLKLNANQINAFYNASLAIKKAGATRDEKIVQISQQPGASELEQALISGNMTAEQQNQYEQVVQAIENISREYEKEVDAALTAAFTSLTIEQRVKLAGLSSQWKQALENANAFVNLSDNDRQKGDFLFWMGVNSMDKAVTGQGEILVSSITISGSRSNDAILEQLNSVHRIVLTDPARGGFVNPVDEAWKNRKTPGFAEKLALSMFQRTYSDVEFTKKLKEGLKDLLARRVSEHCLSLLIKK
jgi:hypothetical protein